MTNIRNSEELPNIYLIHPYDEKVVPFPEPLDDIRKISPESLFKWSMKAILELEVMLWEMDTTIYEAKEAEQTITDEETERLANDRVMFEQTKSELDAVSQRYSQIESELKEDKNEFADKFLQKAKENVVSENDEL